MPSGATVNTPARVMLGTALIKVGGTVIGVTRGGIRRTPLNEVAGVEHDGRVSAHTVGYDRFVTLGERFETTLLQLAQGDLDRILNVSAGAPTAPKANALYTSARYVADVTIVFARGDGGRVEHTYSYALFQWSELSGEDRGTAQYAISIEPALNFTGPATTDDPPYTIKLYDPGATGSIAEQLPQQANLLVVLQPNDGTDQLLTDSKNDYDARFGSTTGADAQDPTQSLSDDTNRFQTNDYLHVQPFVTLNGWSIAVVINRAGTEGGGYIWSFGTDNDPFGHMSVRFGSGGDANKVVVEIPGEGSIMSSTTLGTGFHVLYVRKSPGFGNVEIFFDETSVASANMNIGSTQTTNPRFKIGDQVNGGGNALADTKIGTFALWGGYGLTNGDIAAIQDILRTVYPTLP